MRNPNRCQIVCTEDQWDWAVVNLALPNFIHRKQRKWLDLGYNSILVKGILMSVHQRRGFKIIDIRKLGVPSNGYDKSTLGRWFAKIRRVLCEEPK